MSVLKRVAVVVRLQVEGNADVAVALQKQESLTPLLQLLVVEDADTVRTTTQENGYCSSLQEAPPT